METFSKVKIHSTTTNEPSSTDASHSAIGRSTAIDYNLGSMHKNAILIVDEIVAIGPPTTIKKSSSKQ